MIELIIFCLLSLGVCYGWSDTEVSTPFRNFIAKIPYVHKPFLCHECSSFWISLGLSYFLNPCENYTSIYISNIMCAFIGFFINMVCVRKHLIPYRYELE
jgi:hypothetical protein